LEPFNINPLAGLWVLSCSLWWPSNWKILGT